MPKRTEGKQTLRELFQRRREVRKAIWKLADSDQELNVRLTNDFAFLYSVVRFIDEKTGQVYSDKMSLRVLYLKRLENASGEERQSEVYQWARLISAKDWRVLRELAERNEYFREAVEEMKLKAGFRNTGSEDIQFV